MRVYEYFTDFYKELLETKITSCPNMTDAEPKHYCNSNGARTDYTTMNILLLSVRFF